MKLYLNTTSPYARLVRVMLIEAGLDGETREIIVALRAATRPR